MKKQIKYLCDSGAKMEMAKWHANGEGIYKCPQQSLEGIIVKEGEKNDRQVSTQGKDDIAITWGHVKRNHCGICQPWYKRLERYRE